MPSTADMMKNDGTLPEVEVIFHVVDKVRREPDSLDRVQIALRFPTSDLRILIKLRDREIKVGFHFDEAHVFMLAKISAFIILRGPKVSYRINGGVEEENERTFPSHGRGFV